MSVSFIHITFGERKFLCFPLILQALFPLVVLVFKKNFLTSLLECNCFTRVCQFLLYNKVNQLYVYIYIYPHISSLLRLPPTLPIPPLQVVTKHQADLPVLCGCFPLAIYFTFGSVYMSMPLSQRRGKTQGQPFILRKMPLCYLELFPTWSSC